MEVQEVLTRLCTANGPAGFEGAVAKTAAELLRPLVDELSFDRLGSVIGVRRCGKEGAQRLLLDAHLDEIGFLVTGIEEGFLRFRAIGGVDSRLLLDRELTILTDPPRFGVVACLPPHIVTAADADKSVALDELFVDTGLDQAAAEAAIPVGTPMVFRGGCSPLGERYVYGKALDDRACFTALLRTLELLRDKPLSADLYILGSAREEGSGVGAQVVTYGVEPDAAIAVDVTFGQSPDAPKDCTFKLGGGPAVGVGPNMTRNIGDRIVALAKEREIPIQIEVMGGSSGTNGWGMQVSREGVPTAVVSIPLRYMHSPVEVVCLEDIEQTARLLAAFAEEFGREAVQ